MQSLCAAPHVTQVHADFEYMGAACGLATLCVYGGSPYGPQEGALRRGTDVVVGTPGRVKDLLEKGSLKLDKVRHALETAVPGIRQRQPLVRLGLADALALRHALWSLRPQVLTMALDTLFGDGNRGPRQVSSADTVLSSQHEGHGGLCIAWSGIIP